LENDSHFAKIIDESLELLYGLKEHYVLKGDILKSGYVAKFGFTDTSILIAAKNNNLGVLTRDYGLRNICAKLGLAVFHLDDSILSIGHHFLGY
jgi:hypothetical protein